MATFNVNGSLPDADVTTIEGKVTDAAMTWIRNCQKKPTGAEEDLIEGGVDVLLVETCQDILQCKAAIAGAPAIAAASACWPNTLRALAWRW
jgi:methionine synthase I (cobalamin-dependent)